MGASNTQSALGEWRRSGLIALAGCLGYSAVGLQVYALGPFVIPLEAAFGWSRAEIMLGLSISSAIGVLLNFVVGMLVDRLGPRIIGISGLFLVSTAFALLGTASGSIVNWSALWLLVAFGILLSQSTVWAAAVATRFNRSRGLALALVLSGTSFSAALLPPLATWLIEAIGWRLAFAGVGATWMVLTIPTAYLFIPGKERTTAKRAPSIRGPSSALRTGLRMRAFWQLFLAAFIFAFYTMALSPNLVPLFQSKGMDASSAALTASIVGVTGIVARLGAGYLIDRLPAHLLGGTIFLLPVIGCLILIGSEPSTAALVASAMFFGVTIGAEFDMTFYLASRHFGLDAYGALTGALITAGSLGGVIAPVISGWVYDLGQNYNLLLMILMAMLVVASLSLFALGHPPRQENLA